MSENPHESWEKGFQSEKEAVRRVPVPDAKLERAIRAGVRRADAERRRAGRMRRALLQAGTAAAALLILFAASLRVSPAFAETIGKLPGFEMIARWLGQADKGLEIAVRNEYYQPLEVEAELGDLSLRLEGAIPDEGRLVLFYSVRQNGVPTGDYWLSRLYFRLPGGELYGGGYGYSQFGFGGGEAAPLQVADIFFSEKSGPPDEFTLEGALSAGGAPGGTAFAIPVRLKAWGGTESAAVYEVNRTVEMAGQKALFTKVTMYPTRIGVEVRFDENNEKRVFSFLDLRLTGDGGETFAERSSHWIDPQTLEIFFEGSSFALPDALVLTGSAARALDKDKLDIVIDTEREALLQSPDERLALERIAETEAGWIEVELRLSGIAADDTMLYSVVEAEFTDASGRTFYTGDSHFYGNSGEERTQTVVFRIPAAEYEQPLRFRVFNYPSYIREPFELKIR